MLSSSEISLSKVSLVNSFITVFLISGEHLNSKFFRVKQAATFNSELSLLTIVTNFFKRAVSEDRFFWKSIARLHNALQHVNYNFGSLSDSRKIFYSSLVNSPASKISDLTILSDLDSDTNNLQAEYFKSRE